MPGFFEFPNPIIEKDSHISFSKIGELILRFELKNHSLYKNFPALVSRIRVTRLLWLMPYYFLISISLENWKLFFRVYYSDSIYKPNQMANVLQFFIL